MKKKPQSITHIIFPLAIALLVILGGIAVWYSKRMDEPVFRKDGELTFGRKDSTGAVEVLARIDLEISQGTRQTMQGLMFRSFMPEDQGMLFVFPDEAPRSFWMRNTEISLDIMYANKSGVIVTIQENTTPFSEEQIPSYAPAQFVVEVNAGYCQRHGIREGDQISVDDQRKQP